MKLHTGDSVIVITGKDKGKTGTILRVLPLENAVVVEGINIRTRHMKKSAEQAGRIVKYEASLAACKVMVVDPKTGKPSRIGYQIKDGKKIRISKVSGEIVKKGKMPAKKKVEKAPKSETSPASDTASAKKQPFWQKMKFGSAAIDQSNAEEAPRAQKDQSIPASQPTAHRSGGRGS